MIKRPKRGETEDDILRMQQEYMAEKSKNPKLQPAAQIVKPIKKSLFAKSRQQNQSSALSSPKEDKNSKEIYNEIHRKIVGDVTSSDSVPEKNYTDIVMGEIVEKQVAAPKKHASTDPKDAAAFPKIQKIRIGAAETVPQKGKSIFALAMEKKQAKDSKAAQAMECDMEEQKVCVNTDKLAHRYGTQSVIVEDTKTADEVHKDNLNILSKMAEQEILAERRKLMESIDPALVALLAKKRQVKAQQMKSCQTAQAKPQEPMEVIESSLPDMPSSDLPDSNPAVELIQRGSQENWINFDVVEKDKLEWMRDIPMHLKQLKAGEKFEARFDWKGILLPYSVEDLDKSNKTSDDNQPEIKYERELYLHGDEPNRPGYTLQELFRLARSNVMQQRLAAFNAIAGLLNIYQQGFYDQVLDLPISKIFFLLRFGFDDNTTAMLEVVSKALSYLFYNETDEALLDFIYENPGCHWQPSYQVLNTDSSSSDDPMSIENLQKQMQQLQVSLKGQTFKANIEENEEESKTSMTDFQLAETDLVECLLRTNILQRIYFILSTAKPDNSTVSSCLKILIRLARSGRDVALQIVNNDDLIQCLFDNFLPGFERIDTSLQTTPFYNYPQYLCLKLLRILISSNLAIAVKLLNYNLIDLLQNYLYNRDDIRGKLIKVQIESLRILKCLILLRVENNSVYKKFLPAFRYMLEWHYNHVIYEEGGPYLLRQHAASLLMAVSSISSGSSSFLEITTLLLDILHDCCCSWFNKALRFGVKEFSQATLLSACLNCVTWFIRHTDTPRFQNFISKHLKEFIKSSHFIGFVKSISSSSIVLHKSVDRRTIHNPLPNCGSIIMNNYGPQLIITQTYPFFMLQSLWRLMEMLEEKGEKHLFETLLNPNILEPLVQYLQSLTTARFNLFLATNFYAKIEVKFIYKLLCFSGFNSYFKNSEFLQIVYNFLCCLTAEHIPEIEELFGRVIFNKEYIRVDDADTLKRWQQKCLELVYPHYIVVSPNELTLCMPFTQAPVLPRDWPYFQLKIILQNYLDNVQYQSDSNRDKEFTEREVLQMTLNFVTQLEECNEKRLQIVSPTEKLMYLMIAFMGPDSQFLDKEMQTLLRKHLMKFYEQSKDINFQFDKEYEGKCKFENLYALFVDHFQAASYGDELFSSLVMVPLAQKYDNKWRRRLWSDYASALRFLNCNENLLIGGLAAYLEPPEQEESLLKAYSQAMQLNLVRVNTIPYIIAKHHVDKFRQQLK